jgi:transcriptional regulator with XRE-family HTH domain
VVDRSALRRRGRPQRLPEEIVPKLGRSLPTTARVGWLIATSRLYANPFDPMSQDEFAHRLRDLGLRADASRISRWESGVRPVPWAVIEGYETALGLPPNSLVASAWTARAAQKETHAPEVTEGIRTSGDVEGLLDEALQGRATGAMWVDLARDFAQYERIFLAEGNWRGLATGLVGELLRSSGLSFHRRLAAAEALIRRPEGMRHLSLAVGEVVTDPSAQWPVPAVELIGGLDHPSAAQLVHRLATSGSPAVREAASSSLALQYAWGNLSDADVAGLIEAAGSALVSGRRAFSPAVADVAASISDELFVRFSEGSGQDGVVLKLSALRRTGLLIAPTKARDVSRSLAAAARIATAPTSRGEEDRMLTGLVREAAFHAHRQRRAVACALLAASPYAPALAQACNDLVGEADPEVLEGVLALAGSLGVDLAEDRLLAFGLDERNSSVGVTALHTFAETRATVSAASAESLLSAAQATVSPAHRAAVVRGVAMTCPEQLTSLTRSTVRELRTAAAWWQELGGPVRDPDSHRTPPLPVANPDWIHALDEFDRAPLV